MGVGHDGQDMYQQFEGSFDPTILFAGVSRGNSSETNGLGFLI